MTRTNSLPVNGRPIDLVDLTTVDWADRPSIPLHSIPSAPISTAEPTVFLQTQPASEGANGARPAATAVQEAPAPARPTRRSRKRRHQELSSSDSVSAKVERRNRQVAEAAQLRVHETDPDVVAWRVERTQRVVETILYTGIICGLAFTMVNVQHFAADDEAWSSPTWWAAWVLDPTVSAVLIGILIAGKTLARNGIRLGRWSRTAGAITVVATYTMNTWESWASGEPDQIVLHSIPVLVVFVAVEVLAELRELFARAVSAAHAQAELRTANQPANPAVHEPFANTAKAQSVNSPTRSTRTRPANDLSTDGAVPGHESHPAKRSANQDRKQQPAKRSANTSSRRRLADFVNDAEAAYTPGVSVTPEWVMDKANCSRTSAFAVIKHLRASLPESAFVNDVADSPNAQRSVNQSTDGVRERVS